MGKYAFISDVHGNYLALMETMIDMEKRGVTEIYCLGDVALKYVDPAITTEVVRKNCKFVVQGNVDEFFANTSKIPLNRQCCGEENLTYLRGLPFSKDLIINGFHIRLLHASPQSFDRVYNPKFRNYSNDSTRLITDPSEFFQHTNKLSADALLTKPDIIIHGHTHMCSFEKVADGYLIDAGSVGDSINLSYDANGNIKETLAKEISYIIIDGELDSKEQKDLNVELIRLPYKEILERLKKRVDTHQLASRMNRDRIDASLEYVTKSDEPLLGDESWIIRKH